MVPIVWYKQNRVIFTITSLLVMAAYIFVFTKTVIYYTTDPDVVDRNSKLTIYVVINAIV